MITPKQLKQIRLNNNFKQEEFAEKLGINPEYLSKLENGKNPISYKFVQKLKEKGFLTEAPTLPAEDDAHTREVKEFSEELKISPEALRQILKAVAIEPELMSFAAKAVIEKNHAALERFYNILKSEIQT